jgi:DNA-binding protein HU-beta
VNKQDIINSVAKSSNTSKAAATGAVNAVFSAIKEALRKKKEVRIIGFGSFKTRHVAAKTVRSPRDGSQVRVPACNRVKFSAGKDLKEAANS